MTANFTPALGHTALSGLYDPAIALLTREPLWRSRLLEQVAPSPGETIIDLGCGTGSFAIAMANRAPDARIFGLDPDGDILKPAQDEDVPVERRHRLQDLLQMEAINRLISRRAQDRSRTLQRAVTPD